MLISGEGCCSSQEISKAISDRMRHRFTPSETATLISEEGRYFAPYTSALISGKAKKSRLEQVCFLDFLMARII